MENQDIVVMEVNTFELDRFGDHFDIHVLNTGVSTLVDSEGWTCISVAWKIENQTEAERLLTVWQDSYRKGQQHGERAGEDKVVRSLHKLLGLDRLMEAIERLKD